MQAQRFVFAVVVVSVALVSGSVEGQCQYEAAVIQAPPNLLYVAGLGLNERGDVVGFWRTQFVAGEDMAFLWTQEAGFVTLDLQVDVFQSSARDVNDAGQVVGLVLISGMGYFAFVYASDGVTFIEPAPGVNVILGSPP